jgi:hypothetical protein
MGQAPAVRKGDTLTSDTYWLKSCHGFSVHSSRGSLGLVEEILYEAGPHWPTALVVRGGVFRNRVEGVRTAWIDGLNPTEMVISVRERLAA